MMELAVAYRARAARLKREGMSCLLPNVRHLKLNAARRWEALAEEAEMVARPGNRSAANWIY
jgi:hypothetical protein